MILQDARLRNEVIEKIKKVNFTPEFAVSLALRVYIRKFQDVTDTYLAERVSDIFDVEKRILRNLLGEKGKSLKTLPRKWCWWLMTLPRRKQPRLIPKS